MGSKSAQLLCVQARGGEHDSDPGQRQRLQGDRGQGPSRLFPEFFSNFDFISRSSASAPRLRTLLSWEARSTGTCWRRTSASSRWRRSLRASCSWSRTVAMVPLSLSSRCFTDLVLSRQSTSAFSSTSLSGSAPNGVSRLQYSSCLRHGLPSHGPQ